jgi:hypothetical protein
MKTRRQGSSSKVRPPLEEAKKLLDEAKYEVYSVQESFWEKVGPICQTMTPKESFEFRVDADPALNPWYLGSCKESFNACELDGVCEKDIADSYKYALMSEGVFRVEDESYIDFVEDDDRYCVDWGSKYAELQDRDVAILYIYLHIYKKGRKKDNK